MIALIGHGKIDLGHVPGKGGLTHSPWQVLSLSHTVAFHHGKYKQVTKSYLHVLFHGANCSSRRLFQLEGGKQCGKKRISSETAVEIFMPLRPKFAISPFNNIMVNSITDTCSTFSERYNACGIFLKLIVSNAHSSCSVSMEC